MPLAFVAQLDLATLPQVRDLPLPRVGALFFFFEGGENAWGFSPEDEGSTCVLYSPEPLSSFRLRSHREDLDEELRFKGVALSPQLELTLPGLQDQGLESLEMTPKEREAYFNFRMLLQEKQKDSIHRIGGYPDSCRAIPNCKPILCHTGSIAVIKQAIRRERNAGFGPARKTGNCYCKLILRTGRR